MLELAADTMDQLEPALVDLSHEYVNAVPPVGAVLLVMVAGV